MRLNPDQIEAIKQDAGEFYGTVQVRLFGRMVIDNQCGFTLVELIMTMVIVGILGAVVAPRLLSTNVFQSRGFADQVQASLRYAQKEAIAQHRLVCVALASTSVTLTIASTSVAVTCTLPLISSAGGNAITAPSGVTLTYPSPSFNFDALGKPSFASNQTITVSGATNNIVVEAETGYVHSP